MLKSFIDSLKNEPDLEKRLFSYSCLSGVALSFVGLIINYISDLAKETEIVCLISMFFYSFSFYYYKSKKDFTISSTIFFIFSIVIMDLFYFVSSGFDSAMQSTIIAFMLILSLVQKKEYSYLFLVFFILDLILLFILELNYPNLIVPYPNIKAKQFDIMFSLITLCLLIALIIRLFKNNYSQSVKDINEKNLMLIESEKKLRLEKELVEKANQARSDFLSVMTHEIRTPLNAIISISDLLSNENLSTTGKELIKTLQYSSDNLLSLVSDVLDFNKIDSGEIKLENISFNLKEIITSIEKVYELKAKERDNKIILIFDNRINKNIISDPLRLNQIISNLISNSIKFTNNGEITIKIELGKYSPNNTSIIYFEVKDTGIGMSQEQQEFIFDKFTQADASITRKYGGTGLGLAIIKKLVTLMGGKIELKSELNKGAKFYFSLEFKNDIEISKLNKVLENKVDFSKLKILLVEDNKINIMVTSKFFDKWGIEYDIAENGLIGLEKAKKGNFSLILMDLQMPEMDGFSATTEIRKFNKDTPIFALTANSLSNEKERCLNSGFNDYILKPFKSDELKEKLVSVSNK